MPLKYSNAERHLKVKYKDECNPTNICFSKYFKVFSLYKTAEPLPEEPLSVCWAVTFIMTPIDLSQNSSFHASLFSAVFHPVIAMGKVSKINYLETFSVHFFLPVHAARQKK